jgi:hypothetical protein
MRGVSLLVAAIFLLGASSLPSTPVRLPLSAEEIPAPFVAWYGLYLRSGEAKIGWLRIALDKRRDTWVECTQGHFAATSMGQRAVMDVSDCMEFDAVAPFAFRGGRSEVKQGGSRQVVEVKRGKKGLVAKVVQDGQTSAPPVPALDYTLADALVADLWFRGPRALGDRLLVRSFDLGDLETDVETYTITGRQETIVLGVPTVVYEAATSSARDGSTGLVRADAHGKVLSVELGDSFEARLEPEEIAKAAGRGGDLFVFGMVPLDQPIGPPEKVRQLVLEVDGAGAHKLVDGPRQAVTRDEEARTVTLRLGAGQGADGPIDPEQIDEALAETVQFPTRSAGVVALARRAVGEAKEPREKVLRLVRFVSEYVSDDLLPGELSVPQIVARRKGDCTEHARLFVTLARAAGIPAREVGGLLYMGDTLQKFGGHAWAEVALDGRWVPVDPLWNQVPVDAAHVTLDREGHGYNSVDTLGQLRFRLKEVERAE